MTQLDLPPISFARYVDLLKRRRWQVVPVSLLGLAIGALVAFTVPRYYVTSTDIRFNGEQLLSEDAKRFEDPLTEKIAGARVTIPALAPEVMKELGWPEAVDPDRDARAAFEAEVRSRVSVNDLGPAPKGRVWTYIRIGFRDTDGERAAAFANALASRWMDQQVKEVEEASVAELDELQRARNTLLEERDMIAQEIETFERQHGVDPSLGGNLESVNRATVVELLEREGAAADTERELVRLRSELEGVEERLAEGIPKEIKQPVPPPTDEVVKAKIGALYARILRWETLLAIYTETNQQYAPVKKALDDDKAELQKLLPSEAYETVANPVYLSLERKRDELRRQIREVLAEQEPLRARIAALEARLQKLPGLANQYKEKLQRDATARTRLDENSAALTRAEARRRQILDSKPFSRLTEARAPLRPTDPNITILALLGSLIGLGVAIGLILALDALRFTFKTMQDLEHGLPVPILGGVSHLETVAERTDSRRTRVVASVVGSVVLFLVVVLVTIYYVAPARLPILVYNVLELLLGTGG